MREKQGEILGEDLHASCNDLESGKEENETTRYEARNHTSLLGSFIKVCNCTFLPYVKVF